MAKVKLYDDDMNVVGAKEFSAPSATIKVYDWEDLERTEEDSVTAEQGHALVREIVSGNIIYIKNAKKEDTPYVNGFLACQIDDMSDPTGGYVLTIPYGIKTVSDEYVSDTFRVVEF